MDFSESKFKEKFYEKIRQNIKAFRQETDQNVEGDQSANQGPETSRARQQVGSRRTVPFKEGKRLLGNGDLYGIIKDAEFRILLNTYEEQQIAARQASQSRQEPPQPVLNSKVDGGSFEKLLFSKIGFHHPASTEYLVRDLNIKDSSSRWSFLGGAMTTYDLLPGEDLNSLIKKHNKIHIRQIVLQAWQYLKPEAELHIALQFIKQAEELDASNGDVLACKAKYLELGRNHNEAIKLYKRALENKPDDLVRVKMHYADCLFNIGQRSYMMTKYKEALALFEDALRIHPQHNSAILHRELCMNMIDRNNRFESHRQPAYRK